MPTTIKGFNNKYMDKELKEIINVNETKNL